MQSLCQTDDVKPPNKTQLSRLTITGHIYEHTPICVLIEIADAHGIKYEQADCQKPNFAQHLLVSINQTPIPTITEVKGLPEWGYVARFVNNHSNWPQSKLIQAYNFLLQFMSNDNLLTKLPDQFTVGLQTPEDIFSINACILYKICTHHRLTVNPWTTITQMAYAVRMLRESSESLMRRVKIFVDKSATRTNLVNILLLSNHEVADPEAEEVSTSISYNNIPQVSTTHGLLEQIHNELVDVRSLQQRIDPTTTAGAIALAALNFNIDISKSANPLREYKLLKTDSRQGYQPADPWMRHWYAQNPTIFDLSTKFNPLFPRGFYDAARIVDLALNEGYSQRDLERDHPYELLQVAYLSETFFQGELPNMTERQTRIDLDDIDEVPYGQLLSFGQAGHSMIPITISELTELFRQNENFRNPFRTNEIFGKIAINKLKLIAQSPSGPNPNIRLTQETMQARTDLLNAIIHVEIMQENTDDVTRQFILTYRNSNDDVKRRIHEALTSLLHAGMFMRGWRGSGSYPVSQAVVAESDADAIAVNVTEGLAKFINQCNTLGSVGRQILNLPLVLYRDGQYQAATDHTDGLTILDRINIVQQGEETNNIASCIRLTSNWLCSSAHKYIMCLGFPSPFDIFALRRIS